MGSLRARLIDRNRYAKRYPLIRAPKRLSYLGNENMAIEVGSITFTDTDSGTLTFEIPFPDSSYQIVIATRDDDADEGVNVNIYIDEAASTVSQVTVRSSAKFTGKVDVIAVKLG